MTRRIAVGTLVAVAAALVVAAAAPAQDVVPIRVAPKILALDSTGTWVTIHVAVPYADVAGYTVTINGTEVPAAWDKADLQGNLVIKLRRTLVFAAVNLGPNPVVVEGARVDGSAFIGTKTLLVKPTQLQIGK